MNIINTRTLQSLGFPEPSWDSILAHLWRIKFQIDVLNDIHRASEIKLKTVEMIVHDIDHHGYYTYPVSQIWRLIATDTMTWPPETITSWSDEHPNEEVIKVHCPAKTDPDKYRTYPIRHELIHKACFSL